MAKYRLRATRFIQPDDPERPSHQSGFFKVERDSDIEEGTKADLARIVTLPDDFPAGRDMEPLDDPAKAAVEKWKKLTAVRAKASAEMMARRNAAIAIA